MQTDIDIIHSFFLNRLILILCILLKILKLKILLAFRCSRFATWLELTQLSELMQVGYLAPPCPFGGF
jgi:hypothetical protein